MAKQITCKRCGASYSSSRSRCPSCGLKSPVRPSSKAADNAVYTERPKTPVWQLIFGFLLVGLVVFSVLLTAVSGAGGSSSSSILKKNSKSDTDVQVVNSAPTAEVPPTPEPTPTPRVEDIRIYNYAKDITDEKSWPLLSLSRDGETAEQKGYRMNITARILPAEIENPIVTWTISDPDILHIEPMEDNVNGIIAWQTGTCVGGVTLSAECNGFTQTVKIYCVE